MRLKHLIPEFVRQFEAGMTPRQIADAHGALPGSVRCLINQARPGLIAKRMEERIVASRKQKTTDQIVMRILRGEDLKKIALDCGLTYGAVWQIGRRNGMRRLCQVKLDRAKRMAARAAQGAPQKKIAAEFGISQMGVSQAIRRVKRQVGG